MVKEMINSREEERAAGYHKNLMAKAGALITGFSTLSGIIGILGMANTLDSATFGLLLGTNLQVTSALIKLHHQQREKRE